MNGSYTSNNRCTQIKSSTNFCLFGIVCYADIRRYQETAATFRFYEASDCVNQQKMSLMAPYSRRSEIHQIEWLWQGRIPLGKITILEGDPGVGKSLIALNIAACVSAGHPMPDGTPGIEGGVILIAPEDGAADTIKPRLEAVGGDLNTSASVRYHGNL